MKPYVCTFTNCGHALTVRSWQASSKPCPLCTGLKAYMQATRFFKLEMDSAAVLKEAGALSLVGAKTGGFRRPDSVFKEMYGKDKELMSLWLMVAGDRAPEWVRGNLEGVKSKRKLTPWAEASSLLAKDLTKAFPGCKVSSRSSSYSGGCSVHASVTADPPREFTKEERDLAHSLEDKYQAGHFDGMNDIYVYKEKSDPSIPTVSYVFVTLNNKASSNGGGD